MRDTDRTEFRTASIVRLIAKKLAALSDGKKGHKKTKKREAERVKLYYILRATHSISYTWCCTAAPARYEAVQINLQQLQSLGNHSPVPAPEHLCPRVHEPTFGGRAITVGAQRITGGNILDTADLRPTPTRDSSDGQSHRYRRSTDIDIIDVYMYIKSIINQVTTTPDSALLGVDERTKFTASVRGLYSLYQRTADKEWA